MSINDKFAVVNQSKIGRPWTNAEIAQGFVGDVGVLMKLDMAKEGVRGIFDAHNKLRHEFADSLWSILILSEAHKIMRLKHFLVLWTI